MSEPQPTHSTPLYQLVGEAARAASLIQEILDNTELEDKARDAALDAAMANLEISKEAIPAKVENCIKYIKSLQRQQEAIRAEETALAARRKQHEAAETRMRDYVSRCLRQLDGHKLSFPVGSASWTIRKDSKVEITDAQLLPTKLDYWRVKKEPNVTALKDALKAGEQIGGCRLIDTEVLTIR